MLCNPLAGTTGRWISTTVAPGKSSNGLTSNRIEGRTHTSPLLVYKLMSSLPWTSS